MGAGMAGLSASLVLARAGHRVTLVERDELSAGAAGDSPAWPRQGIPHFLQPHAFIPRGRAELRRALPDVYAELLAAGAHDVDMRPKLPGEVVAADEELQYLAVRRPLIEWALRRAVENEPTIEVRAGGTVNGLSTEKGRVVGVSLSAGEVPADVVVDALGRRTPRRRWLAEAGVTELEAASNDCGVVYYSRYYRQRPGFDLPDGPWLLGPRGDLGYLGFATFPGDNGTFAALLAVPTGTAAWRGLRRADVFEAAVALIPGLRTWVDPDGVEPITDVLPMAGLRNTISDVGPAVGAGVVPVGDAYSHTDPVMALGLSFALVHATTLAAELSRSAELDVALAAYVDATMPALLERFALATELDDQRHRGWTGEAVDFAHRDGAYATFSVVAAGVASAVDPEVFRRYSRRVGLLESTQVLDSDIALQERIETLFAQLTATPRARAGPDRDTMLAVASSGVAE